MTAMPRNPRRCLLFVPGSRPERFKKALVADADQVCIDLEDAVPPAEKTAARNAALSFIARGVMTRSEVGMRINPVASIEGIADMAAISASIIKPAFVMLAKVENALAVLAAQNILGDIPLIALLESPGAIFNARAIASATKNLQALMFGGYDYAVAARVAPRGAGWLWPRSMLSAAAAEAGIGAIDVPSLEMKDMTAVQSDTEDVIALGFSGRGAIHPAQVAAIQNAYLPAAIEIERAERVVSASTNANGAAISVDGKLVDLPIELAARRVIGLAKFGVRTTNAMEN